MNEINVEKASQSGIDIVRRPTGGRAILHSDELTYSVVMRTKGKNILSVYDEISHALVTGLNELGADVAIEKSQPHFPSLYRTGSATACFSSAGRYEIKYQGKKLVGSAQRRYSASEGEEVVLQHGSILLGSDHKRISEFINFSTENDRISLCRELDEKTTDLTALLRRRVTAEETAEALLKGFQKAWSITFEEVNMIHEETRMMI